MDLFRNSDRIAKTLGCVPESALGWHSAQRCHCRPRSERSDARGVVPVPASDFLGANQIQRDPYEDLTAKPCSRPLGVCWKSGFSLCATSAYFASRRWSFPQERTHRRDAEDAEVAQSLSSE